VYALFAHPDAWSTGAGGVLLRAARSRLQADGFGQQVLWVMEANARGRAFYERQGMHPTGRQSVLRLGGAALTELEYATPAPAEAADSGQENDPATAPADPRVVAQRRSAVAAPTPGPASAPAPASATPARRGA
jgi:hypothetical protein